MSPPDVQARPIAICAGGTGGHLFPAEALSAELKRRGYKIILLTDSRGLMFGDSFPCDEIHRIPSSTLSPRAPLKAVIGLGRILAGTARAFAILKNSNASTIAGFGGYPTLPPLVAAKLLGLPAFLHEQNAVMGRANRFLARFARVVALSFEATQKTPDTGNFAVVTTGNPVRSQVIALANTPYEPAAPGSEFRLLVFGGSQGASVFSDVVPEALALFDAVTKKCLKVTQQCRPEDLDFVKAAYKNAGIEIEAAAFFPDLPQRIADAHLVVARSGASTLSELTIIGRPSVLVPLPGSLDNDQRENARALEATGGAWVFDQSEFVPEQFANLLETFMHQPDLLSQAATAARQNGRPEAAIHLADALEDIITKQKDKK